MGSPNIFSVILVTPFVPLGQHTRRGKKEASFCGAWPAFVEPRGRRGRQHHAKACCRNHGKRLVDQTWVFSSLACNSWTTEWPIHPDADAGQLSLWLLSDCSACPRTSRYVVESGESATDWLCAVSCEGLISCPLVSCLASSSFSLYFLHIFMQRYFYPFQSSSSIHIVSRMAFNDR